MNLLSGKNILMVGGNGFLGSYLASRFVRQNANVAILSRKGPKYNHPQNNRFDWLIGDIMHPQKYRDTINKADAIVHTVGTLFDTSITKFRKEGEIGTYQHMNLETFRSLLNCLNANKQIIYFSAMGRPPFIKRYSQTKQQAEQLLFNTNHDGYVVRPGFVYDWQHRKWSIPLKYSINVWRHIYPTIYSWCPNQSYIQTFMKQFEQWQPTSLSMIGDCLIEVIKQGCPQKIIQNKLILQYSNKYNEQKKKDSL